MGTTPVQNSNRQRGTFTWIYPLNSLRKYGYVVSRYDLIGYPAGTREECYSTAGAGSAAQLCAGPLTELSRAAAAPGPAAPPSHRAVTESSSGARP